MTSWPLNERMRLSAELALMGVSDDPSASWQQYSDAKRIGIREAEIDIARHGRSFDVQTASAQVVALAALSGDHSEQIAARAKAVALGLCEGTCRKIEAFARHFITASKPGSAMKR